MAKHLAGFVLRIAEKTEKNLRWSTTSTSVLVRVSHARVCVWSCLKWDCVMKQMPLVGVRS